MQIFDQYFLAQNHDYLDNDTKDYLFHQRVQHMLYKLLAQRQLINTYTYRLSVKSVL